MVGSRTAELLAEAFPDVTFRKLWTTDIENLLSITEVGPKGAAAIKVFTSQHPYLPEELASMSIKPQLVQLAQSNILPLAGHTIVISGTLPTMSRNEAKIYLQNMGARVVDVVSNKTTILVAGEKAGTKLVKAKSLGIPIKDENWLLTKNIRNNQHQNTNILVTLEATKNDN
jgi:DNA ligase (NAD+)